MSSIPDHLKYTDTHEWVLPLADGTLRVGITDYAQNALGDLVFVDLPKVGKTYTAGGECAVLESVKSASDLYCPVAGSIVEVNDNLTNNPELINQSPYENGWIYRVQPEDSAAVASLLDAAAYQNEIAQE